MKNKLCGFIVTSFLFFTFQVFAAPPTSNHPCTSDAYRFCRDVDPGQGRLRKCLKKHKKQLAPACVAKLKDAEHQMKRIMKACKKDRKALCAGTKDKSDVMKCLSKNKSDLSQECRAESKKTF